MVVRLIACGISSEIEKSFILGDTGPPLDLSIHPHDTLNRDRHWIMLGDDLVLRLLAIKSDGNGGGTKQVNHRRAVKFERLRAHLEPFGRML